jgi:polyisoprenoid-binding protein YceI
MLTRVSAVSLSLAGLFTMAAARAPAREAGGRPRAPAARLAPAPGRIRFVLSPTGNTTRYKVREQLVGVDFPTEAVGVTDSVTGALVLGTDGKVVREESKFVVNIRPLKSDRPRRDSYIQRRTLQTDSFPTVTLVPTELRGLPAKLPATGALNGQLVGDLTVHGVTRPTTWQLTGQVDHDRLKGTVSTGFTFADFGLVKPSVAIVLTVADSIHLEYDFDVVRDSTSKP